MLFGRCLFGNSPLRVSLQELLQLLISLFSYSQKLSNLLILCIGWLKFFWHSFLKLCGRNLLYCRASCLWEILQSKKFPPCLIYIRIMGLRFYVFKIYLRRFTPFLASCFFTQFNDTFVLLSLSLTPFQL